MRARIKPSKAASSVAIIFGIGMAVAGIFMIPQFGWFGILWLGGVLLIIIMHAANISSSKGVSVEDIDIDNPTITTQSKNAKDDFEQKLRKLESLKKDSLITEEEYGKKRSEIMKHNW